MDMMTKSEYTNLTDSVSLVKHRYYILSEGMIGFEHNAQNKNSNFVVP